MIRIALCAALRDESVSIRFRAISASMYIRNRTMKNRFTFHALLMFAVLAPVYSQTSAKPVVNGMATAGGFGGYAGAAAPGSYVEIYGSNLAGASRGWANSDFKGPAAPTTHDGVTVTVNGTPAYISYVSPAQINIEVPDNITAGAPVPVVVSYQGQSSAPAMLMINALQPGFLAPPSFKVGGTQYAVAVHANGTFVSSGNIPGTQANPAAAGETLTFYGIGFGPLKSGPAAGQIASGQSAIANTFTMSIGNVPVTITYAGLAPGLVGVYQFNVVVPQNAPAGDQAIQTTLNGIANTLQTLTISVRGAAAPGPPQNVTATAGDGSAIISFTVQGGGQANRYVVSCAGGGATVTASGTASPIIVTGLTNGIVYSCTVATVSPNGTGNPSPAVTVTPAASGSAGTGFRLTSSAGTDGGTLPVDYTCDGTGSTIPLSWSNVPAGTKEFALLMTTLPGDGSTKWNWVLYHIPATTTSLAKDSFLIGTLGTGSDGPGTVYNPPCSQGPGLKIYTYTLYALSDIPTFSVPANQVNGQMVTDAISSLKLGSAVLNLGATRTTNTGSSTGCAYINSSTRASKSGTASVSCDGTYAYVGSIGITTQPMMNGITSTNLQVPIPVNFQGANGWKIPLNPAIAAAPTSVVDGPLGVAINGVPIFNPCTQGGCTGAGGDTKALGQLDTCNGHAGRADDYHYHAAPTCMMADQPPTYWDTHPLGWALDGFAIFGYRDADGTTAVRDNVCGGNTKAVPNAPAGYSYHVTDASPYVTSCLIGTPSPDLPNQGSKYKPLRQPPVTPFNNTGMTLTIDATDGYQVLQFTSAITFRTNETGSDNYTNPPGTYKIRYKQVTGSCWNFQFLNSSDTATQPTVTYCK